MVQERQAGTLRDGYWIKRVPSTYTPAQVAEYLKYVGFTHHTEVDIASGGFLPTFDNLGILVRLHFLTFPFENTAMHYTPHHTMDVSPAGAFQRFVHERNGSYCFGHNNLFLQILRGLGYRAYAGSARVNMAPSFAYPPEFSYFSHSFIFVQPFESNQTYIVDVGFGATGLTRPILLSDAEDNIVYGTSPTERHRLRFGSHPLSSVEDPSKSISSALSWQLEAWHDKADPATPSSWRVLFTFPETEFLDIDIENASFVTAQKPEGLFWDNVFCMRHLLIRDVAPPLKEEIYTHPGIHDDGTFMYRRVMIGNKVTEHIGTSTTTIRTLESERDRMVAMRELFGIQIEDSAMVHIAGRVPSLG